MGGNDVQFIFCDMHVFPKYISAQLIFSRLHRSRIFISEYTFTSVQKTNSMSIQGKEHSALFVVEKLNGHIFHFFLVPDQRWKK
jgi:hypothetical protein